VNTHEIENSLEDAALLKEGWAIAYALLRCAKALENCAYQLKSLGNADAATPMGALEAHGLMVKEAGSSIYDGLTALAEAFESK
jgi:hypothetical protein